jgi:phosphatidylserine decarboxylase
MRIHREGYLIILISTISVVVAWLLIDNYIHLPLLKYILLAGLLLFLLWVVRFFRYPEREVNRGDHILSTADGRVVAIEEVNETEYFDEKRLMVSIFMSPFNVHVNWYPFDGDIKYSKYHPGRFLIAHHPKSSELNECTSVVLEGKPGDNVLIRQVAGFLARRIICYSKAGDTVKQGEEMGIIRFGSRVDFFLPLDTKIDVKIGQKVVAQKTVIGRF